jgi:hypothetical protein
MPKDLDTDLPIGGQTHEDDHIEDEGGDRGDDFVPTEDPPAAAPPADDPPADDPPADDPPADDPPADDPPADDPPADDPPADDPPADDPPADDPPADDPAPPTIPPAVLARAKERARAAEDKVAKYEAEKAAAAAATENAYDFTTKEMEYMELVSDGELEKALAVRQEIRAAERAEYAAEHESTVTRATEVSRDNQDFDAAVADATSRYPELDTNSPSVQHELIDVVLDDHRAFVANGYSSAKAMERAVRINALEAGLVDRTVKVEPQPPAEPAKPLIKPPNKELREAHKNATPPDTTNAGKSPTAGESFNLDDMTEDEFDAMPPSRLAALRGDVVG